MIGSKMIRFLIFTFFFFNYSFADNPSYNVQHFGAYPNGTDCKEAFLDAWAAACDVKASAATIYVPPGEYVLSETVFKGDSCNNNAITIKIDGTLSLARSAFDQIAYEGNWLVFQEVAGVTIQGGILDGQGEDLWNCKKSGKTCPRGAMSLAIYNSNNVTIYGLTSKNSQFFHIHIIGCQTVTLNNTIISAPGNSTNTDGIHIAVSSDVTILNSIIGTGDDCISIGPGSKNLWIEETSCGPGHGISIGSLGWCLQEAGVQNVTVKTATFNGTQNGMRIKTWATHTNAYVTNVLFQHIVIANSSNPILIDQKYCPHDYNCPKEDSGVEISDITYQDIHGTSASQVAVSLDCSHDGHCSRIEFDEVKPTYNGQSAKATCNSAYIQISPNVSLTC